jgi:uncharacterized membrane protein YqjE
MTEGYDTGGHADPTRAGYGRDRIDNRQANDARPRGTDGESVGSLISGLIQDLQEMVRDEIRLARAELRDDAMTAGRGVAVLAAGALVGLTGFIFLMLGATYLLNKWVQMWIAAGIVGVVLAVVAAVCIYAGRNKLRESNFTPEQTIATLKEDREWAKQQTNSVRR